MAGQRKSAYDRALDLLARRPHFAAEIGAKLARKGYDEGEVEAAVAKLLEKCFLDDLDTARQRIRQRLGRGPLGRPPLRADLLRKGASSEVAEAALDELVAEDDLPAARQATQIWRRTRVQRSRAALARHLGRKGFSRRAIFAVLAEAAEDSAEDDLPDFP